MIGYRCLLSCSMYLERSGKNCMPSYGWGSSELVLTPVINFSLTEMHPHEHISRYRCCQVGRFCYSMCAVNNDISRRAIR